MQEILNEKIPHISFDLFVSIQQVTSCSKLTTFEVPQQAAKVL